MADANHEVFDMVKQLQARLKDVEHELAVFEGDPAEYVAKLDRIDDQLYLLVSELEQKSGTAAPAAASPQAAAAPSTESTASAPAASASDDDEGMNILTPEAKQKLGETVGDMRELGRDAAAALSELNEAFSDITEPFKAFTKPGRRR